MSFELSSQGGGANPSRRMTLTRECSVRMRGDMGGACTPSRVVWKGLPGKFPTGADAGR